MPSPAPHLLRLPSLVCLAALAGLLLGTAPAVGAVPAAPDSAPSLADGAAAPSGGLTSPRRNSRYPDASNTGVRASRLIAVPSQSTSGPGWRWDGAKVVVTRDGARISRLDVNGAVFNDKHGVVIKNSRIRCTNEESWCVTLGSGSTLRDSEVGGGEDGTSFQPSIGVLSGDYDSRQTPNLVLRVDIHHTVHGMRVDGDTTVLDSYLHDFPMGDAGWEDAHTNGIMCTAGSDVLIRHNTIVTGNTAPVFVQWQEGNVGIASYRIRNNLIVGVERHGQLSSYGVMFEDQGIDRLPVIRANKFKGAFQAGHILAPRGSTVTDNATATGRRVRVDWD
ncbi:hypothetical protein [Nocardioides sp. P5_E3]